MTNPTSVTSTTLTPVHRASRRDLLSRFLLPMIALALIVIFSIVLPRTFPTVTTMQAILNSTALIALLALAEMLVVIIGEYDLSVGYMAGLQSILTIGFIVKQGMPWPLVVVLILLIGIGVGILNGVLIYIFKIDSFIVTLGVGTIAFAVANWYTQGNQLFGTLPQGFINIYSAKLFGIPAPAFYVVGLAAICWFVLEYTPTGRYLYALGANRRAAELTGISSRKIVIGVFAVSGLIVAFAGIVLASQLRIGSVSTGPDFLLPVFVGAVLGSATIKPGRPNAWGTVVAVVLLGIGIAGLQQIGASYFVQPLFNGITLIVGVGVAGYASRRIRKSNKTSIPTPQPALAPSGAPTDSPTEKSPLNN
ncbi:ABC transporter permease [Subtercola lobariae]|uniref:Sugar ABC transporter permease n=1 Tax=Subtercola lobariae TaxID=1588641 RepID=A0A917B0R7_9MICO|nr:ABC transporter permease [Subtercola lobariae]GGF10500.1 sugar ABC transporter permease [Subtercola lobariae]